MVTCEYISTVISHFIYLNINIIYLNIYKCNLAYIGHWTFSPNSCKSSNNDFPKTTVTTADGHKSNGLIDDQKSTNTSKPSAITDTHSEVNTTIAAKDSPASRPEVQKSAVTPPSQTSIESKDEGLPAGQQRSSTSITIRGQQAKKSSFESSTKVTEQAVQKKEPDSIRSSGRNVVPAVTNRMTRESRTEALGRPPSFDIQPQNQEVTEGTKVTFKCQGKPR